MSFLILRLEMYDLPCFDGSISNRFHSSVISLNKAGVAALVRVLVENTTLTSLALSGECIAILFV